MIISASLTSLDFPFGFFLRTTKAQGVSPQKGCGIVPTAASWTFGCLYNTDSNSTLLIVSPPDTIKFFDPSLISKYPSGCMTPTSPAAKLPFLNAFEVDCGSFNYPFMILLPCMTISFIVLPSRGTLIIVFRSLTSKSASAR